MKQRYRLFLRRKSVFYAFGKVTKTFESLGTKDRDEAQRLVIAKNEALKQPAMNLSLARVYLRHSDPLVAKRTWQQARAATTAGAKAWRNSPPATVSS